MCGICGVVSRHPEVSDDPVRRMMNALHHRGPDGEGEYRTKHIHIGMRRLSIIDLKGGWQPFYNEDRSLVLIVNGEIYNYIELRHQLIEKGHVFLTKNDCEVIVHLYEDYDLDCLRYLRGMFAFALWDANRRRLFVARDRMGEKPFYIFEKKGVFYFSSELKSLLASGSVPLVLSPVAINNYFHFGYVPEPETPLQGVRKLPAASYLTIDIDSWDQQQVNYWDMAKVEPMEGDPGSLIRCELERLSELIVRSDVPVGVALSGGLDSSAIAALATKKYPGTIHAFSVGYSSKTRNDERAQAREFANYLKIPFTDIELHKEDLVSFFPQLVYWQDDPIADIAGYGYFSVMSIARSHNVPVILQGHGGDELFWGYPWARQAVLESRRKEKYRQSAALPKKPYFRLNMPTSFAPSAIFSWVLGQGGIRQSIHSYQRDSNSPPEQMVFYDLSADFVLAQREVNRLYPDSFRAAVSDRYPTEIFSLPLPWPQIETTITKLLCQTYLLENGIAQGDRLSMASSVELRLPLLDYKLVETIIGLRKGNPDADLAPKHWLKKAIADILPSWVVNRPKRGFAPPVRLWHKSLFSKYGDNLLDGVLVEQSVLTKAAGQELSKGLFPFGVTAPLSFKALVLEMWCRNYFK